MCFLNSSLQREPESTGLEVYVSLYLTFLSADLTANPEITAAALLLQVYGEHYVDQMGLIGYFPSNHVNETHVFQKKTVEIPTTVSI